MFDELSFQIFEENKKPKIVSCRKCKNPQIQKINIFFEKSMLPLKILRIVLRSFLVLNDQNRNDSVFFKFGRRRAKRGPYVFVFVFVLCGHDLCGIGHTL